MDVTFIPIQGRNLILGLTVAESSTLEVRNRVDKLAKPLSKELHWSLDRSTEWEKAVGVFSVNTRIKGTRKIRRRAKS